MTWTMNSHTESQIWRWCFGAIHNFPLFLFLLIRRKQCVCHTNHHVPDLIGPSHGRKVSPTTILKKTIYIHIPCRCQTNGIIHKNYLDKKVNLIELKLTCSGRDTFSQNMQGNWVYHIDLLIGLTLLYILGLLEFTYSTL
jgi:hypothetical protein